jgi:polar amino acid transport system substrate-binding protein
MPTLTRNLAVLVASIVTFAACVGAASPAPSSTQQATAAATPEASPTTAVATPNPDDLLAKIKAAGKLRVSTDAAYPPQSELKDGKWEGFDVDTATEIAKRLGVSVEFTAQDWAVITAGNWGGRWDVSVGSMTITGERVKTFDFSTPYYYTPAQIAASEKSGITDLAGLKGKTVCAGEATTYWQWLTGQTLDLGPGTIVTTKPPEGVKVVTRPTDRDCAEDWKNGRFDFEAWMSSSTTVEQAIKDGIKMVKVGDPQYFEPLAVAVDRNGPAHGDFMQALDGIIFQMHADHFLNDLSTKWFGLDLTVKIGG